MPREMIDTFLGLDHVFAQMKKKKRASEKTGVK